MLDPPFVPLITQLPASVTGWCILPRGNWTDYETETLHLHRVWWRFGTVTVKLDEYRAGGLPNGITCDPADGTLSGTPGVFGARIVRIDKSDQLRFNIGR